MTTIKAKMRKMNNPPHPGSTLREDILPALDLTVTAAAVQLGVTRVTLSRILNEKASITPEMAVRIEKWLGIENGGNAEIWLAEQMAYDLWHARKTSRTKIKNIRSNLAAA
jgi:addiction module HigA family antidote